MTEAEKDKLIADMARFLRRLCQRSDGNYGAGRRSTTVERDYQVAMKLIARADAAD